MESTYNLISHAKPQHQITTDASSSGFAGVSSGGNWTHLESKYHINYLEMLAIFLGLKTLAKEKTYIHSRVLCDNTTAVNIVNHMGTSHSETCNLLAKEIWEW